MWILWKQITDVIIWVLEAAEFLIVKFQHSEL